MMMRLFRRDKEEAETRKAIEAMDEMVNDKDRDSVPWLHIRCCNTWHQINGRTVRSFQFTCQECNTPITIRLDGGI